jgi:glutamate--cysteine ligase catalytic subunit
MFNDLKKPLKNNKFVINKSRYDSIDSYLSQDKHFKAEYNDIDLVYDKEIYDKLMKNGVDDLLAKHIAHLFIRDPLVIYKELVEQDNENSTDHFENIQSTNWQTMRFKPPPAGSPIGWRVEFRSMEVQLTDFENAAFSIFIVLITRAILSFNLNFYIPISKVDENLKRAHDMNSVLEQQFYFRKQVYSDEQSEDDEVVLMTINQIVNGDVSRKDLIDFRKKQGSLD